MNKPTTLFFDIGGVVLSNGWDTPAREKATAHFGLDNIDFQKRHGMVKTAFETGRMSLDTYLAKTVFHKPRSFTPKEFSDFMSAQSTPNVDVLNWLRDFSKSRKLRLFALNNESREMHEYRKEKYSLHDIFDGFLTSCYLGSVKPDEEIYLSALGIAACRQEQSVFIDDRPLNVETAATLGFKTIQFTGLGPMLESLKNFGVAV